MSALDDAFEAVQKIDNSKFRLKKDSGMENVYENFSSLAFFGEYDKEKVYLQMPIQKIEDGVVSYYTPEEIINFDLDTVPYTSLHILIDLERKYVKIFQDWNANFRKAAKDNFGDCFQKYTPKVMYKIPENEIDFLVENLEDEQKDVWEKLIKILNAHRTSPITIANLNLRLTVNSYKVFDNKSKDGLLNACFQESDTPDTVDVSSWIFTKVPVPEAAKRACSLVINRDTIDWDGADVYKKGFSTLKEAKNTFCSIIKYYNSLHPECTIKELEKHSLAYLWPTTDDTDEAAELKEELTRFEIRISSNTNGVIFRFEVWEMGIVYILTNDWESIKPGIDADDSHDRLTVN